MTTHVIALHECSLPIAGRRGNNDFTPLRGTGFRLFRSDLVVTAKHVVEDFDTCIVGCPIGSKSGRLVLRSSVEILFPPDETSDLAVLRLADHVPAQCFSLVPPEEHQRVFGQPIASYGYPGIEEDLAPKPRMMFGHIQRSFIYSNEDRAERYAAYELGFPAFGGQSGSPVFLNTSTHVAVKSVVAVVTNSLFYTTMATSASWAIGMSLEPFDAWLRTL